MSRTNRSALVRSGRDRAWWLSTGGAILLASAVLLPLLGHKPLTDWDEGIYAEVSREMLTSGWLTPHWNGMVWLEKPPLMLWITAFFFRLFGVNGFWSRAASAFSGVTLVAVLHGWLLLRRDRLTAWLTTIFLLTTVGFLHICRIGEMDAVLSLGTVVAMIGLAEVDAENKAGWYLFWCGFAFALMTKGAASVVILLTLILLAAGGGWRRWTLRSHFWTGIFLFLALTLPWHLAMWNLYREHFIEEYLGFHVLVRATQQIEGHITPWWYFGSVLLSYASPFILLYPFTIRTAWRDARMRVWIIFPVVVITFFTLVQTRLPHYIAPVYPALALLAACFVAELWKRHGTNARLNPKWITIAAATGAFWIASVTLTGGLRNSLHRAGAAGAGAGAGVGGADAGARAAPETRDRRESIDMARTAATLPYAGPLLIWRNGAPASIAAEVFYSGRHVEQVALDPIAPGPMRNRYAETRVPLKDVLTAKPELMLVDSALLSHLPTTAHFITLRSGHTVTLGTVSRMP